MTKAAYRRKDLFWAKGSRRLEFTLARAAGNKWLEAEDPHLEPQTGSKENTLGRL